MGSSLSRGVVAAILYSLLAGASVAATHYNVRLNTSQRLGLRAHIAFDLTSSGDSADSLQVLDFVHDGKAKPSNVPGANYFEGGPVFGDLLDGANPSPRTVVGSGFFYNQLSVPFDSLGTSVAFAIQLPEPSAPAAIPDEMSFFYLADSVTAAFPTADPLGTGALFAVDVTGQSGGDLSVFAPMQFVPPDTLRMANSTTGVLPGGLEDRLRFRSVAPNPSLGDVQFIYDVPAPGGLLQINVFDIAGRLIAKPFNGKKGPGTSATRWDATDARGRAVPSGVYIVQLQMAGQSLVRRIVLTR